MPYLQSSTYELPFQSGSETSRDAAIAIEPVAETQRERYFAFVALAGTQGRTDAEAESWLRMRRSSVCARRNELMKAGRIVQTDRRRKGCTVYRVKE